MRHIHLDRSKLLGFATAAPRGAVTLPRLTAAMIGIKVPPAPPPPPVSPDGVI
ncbi:MAG TPA: hypothetical protein VGL58_02635 [Caulobacteraceae bacterium]|jgi:hypothetical protein